MKPTADISTPKSISLRALLSVSLILLLSLTLGGVLEYVRLQERAAEQAADISLAFGRSSAILIQPLVLSDDRISLNYLLNELAGQPLINGLRLTAPDHTLIALAGDSRGRMHTLELVQGEVPIGQLTIWGNTTSFSAPLQAQLTEIALLAGISIAIAAVLLLFSLQRTPTSRTAARPRVADVEADIEQPRDSDRIPDFHFGSEPQPAPVATPVRPQPPAATPSEPALKDTPAPGQPPASEDDPDTRLDTGALVALLKPEHDPDAIPRFHPSSPASEAAETDSDEALVPDLGSTGEDEFRFDEVNPAAVTDRPANPLQLEDREPPAVLSRLEQELELLLTPEEAGYLMLIDTRSAHSDNLDEEEREQLLHNYRTLANSAARIYSGDISTLKDGNLCILFRDGDDRDSHGVNALCCAMLFTWLYKQYNQQQIRAFRPVMNLHMSLVRGARESVDRMQEEARFLTRTTQSNELISHTALTEAPLLKEMLLQQADIRREDEDKVLILSISDAYQTLLEKQATHLLAKLNEREQGNAGA